MKILCVCNNLQKFNWVYSAEILQTLQKQDGFDGQVYCKDDILREPAYFVDTEYIFSTWGMPAFTEEEIRTVFPNLKSVFYAAGTVQAFARPFLNCGVQVYSAWAANAVPVAEYTVAQIILANKGFFAADRVMRTEGYKASKNAFAPYSGNYGAKVGIVGAGMIGKLVIQMLRAYKVEVLVYDPFLPDAVAEQLGVKKVGLRELFAKCDVVSNHLANNEQTRGIFNHQLFSVMPQNATFLNTGRGAQVVEADLIRVLSERPDLTAILDVTAPEPPIPGSPLYSLPNCILTPHIAGSSGDEVHRMAEYMLAEFEAYLSGAPTCYAVTLEMLATMA